MTSDALPDDRMYSIDHEWVTLTSGEVPTEPVRVGITRLAADNLGDLVYIELPEVGSSIEAGQTCGEVESTKTVSELIAPVTGTVIEVNSAVANDPSIISSDPYTAGWLFGVEVSALGPLLTAIEYADQNGLPS